MSFCATMFSSNVSEVMVKLVDDDIWIVQIVLTRDVDRLLPVYITAESTFLPSGQANSEFRLLDVEVLGEELQRVLGSS